MAYSATLTNVNILNLRSVFTSTYGIIFLGTPHMGSDTAKWGLMMQSMCNAMLPRKLLDSEPHLVTALKTQSETLQNINLGFVDIMDRFHVCLFHEAEKTDLGTTRDFVRAPNESVSMLRVLTVICRWLTKPRRRRRGLVPPTRASPPLTPACASLRVVDLPVTPPSWPT